MVQRLQARHQAHDLRRGHQSQSRNRRTVPRTHRQPTDPKTTRRAEETTPRTRQPNTLLKGGPTEENKTPSARRPKLADAAFYCATAKPPDRERRTGKEREHQHQNKEAGGTLDAAKPHRKPTPGHDRARHQSERSAGVAATDSVATLVRGLTAAQPSTIEKKATRAPPGVHQAIMRSARATQDSPSRAPPKHRNTNTTERPPGERHSSALRARKNKSRPRGKSIFESIRAAGHAEGRTQVKGSDKVARAG